MLRGGSGTVLLGRLVQYLGDNRHTCFYLCFFRTCNRRSRREFNSQHANISANPGMSLGVVRRASPVGSEMEMGDPRSAGSRSRRCTLDSDPSLCTSRQRAAGSFAARPVAPAHQVTFRGKRLHPDAGGATRGSRPSPRCLGDPRVRSHPECRPGPRAQRRSHHPGGRPQVHRLWSPLGGRWLGLEVGALSPGGPFPRRRVTRAPPELRGTPAQLPNEARRLEAS